MNSFMDSRLKKPNSPIFLNVTIVHVTLDQTSSIKGRQIKIKAL